MQSPAIFGGMNHLNAQQGMMNRLTHQHAYASSQHSNGVMTAGNSPDTNTSSLEFGAPRPPPNHQPQRPQETASGSMPHASHSGFHDRNHYHHQQQQQQHASQPGAMPNGDMYGKHSNGVIDGPNGLITPIQSGEIMASNMNLQMGSNGNSNSMHPPGSAHAPPEGAMQSTTRAKSSSLHFFLLPLLNPVIQSFLHRCNSKDMKADLVNPPTTKARHMTQSLITKLNSTNFSRNRNRFKINSTRFHGRILHPSFHP